MTDMADNVAPIASDAISAAIRGGAHTVDEVADALGVGHANATLRKTMHAMFTAGQIVKDGSTYLDDGTAVPEFELVDPTLRADR